MAEVSRKYIFSLSVLTLLTLVSLSIIAFDPDLTHTSSGIQSAAVYINQLDFSDMDAKISGAFVAESADYKLEGAFASGGIIANNANELQVISTPGTEVSGGNYKLVLWPITTGRLAQLADLAGTTFYCIRGQTCTFSGAFTDDDIGTSVDFGWILMDEEDTTIDEGEVTVTIPASGSVSQDFTNTFTTTGTYDIDFVVTDEGVETSVSTDMIILIPGDADGSGSIDAEDFFALVTAYGVTDCDDPAYNSFADLGTEADCDIDADDFFEFVQNYQAS